MRTIVITGSTRGIGLGLAREFLKHGCRVAICGREEKSVKAAFDELSAFGDSKNIHAQTCDVANYHDVKDLWDKAAAKFGKIDIWINNAGTTTRPVKLHEIPSEEIFATINTKLLGGFYGAKVAIEGMLGQGGGQIYFVEGIGGKDEVQEGVLALGAGNRGTVYLVKALQKEYKDSGILFCRIRPGINITEHLLKGVKYMDRERWERSKKILNILGDLPETTTPFLAEKVLANNKNGAVIAWLSTPKILGRFLTASFKKRDLIGNLENEQS